MMSDEDIKRTSIGSISIRSTASENNNHEIMSTLESVSQTQNIQSSTDNNTSTATTPTRTANRRASVETIDDQTGPTPPPPMIQDEIEKAEEESN